MKQFVVYTALRIVLFAATLGVVMGSWVLISGHADVFVAVVIAFIISGLGSWFLLQRPRNAFAQQVEARAERATAAFDARRAREDSDTDDAASAASDELR